MASDHDPTYPPASSSHPPQPLSSVLFDDLFDDPYGYTEAGLGPEFVGATTTPFPLDFVVPEATFGSNIFVHHTTEDPTGPSQTCLSSEYGPGIGSSAPEYSASYNEFDTGNLLLAAPASDAPQVPRTHSVGFSSEYGTSQAVPEGPPITASTSGEAQVNPSTGLRIFHSPRHEGRKNEWRDRNRQVYSIEIARHCLEPELWENWNGQLYINRSTYDNGGALYLRIDAQTSESKTTAPVNMCERCQKNSNKPYPRKGRHYAGQPPPDMSHLGRIYCNWQLAPLQKTSNFFEGEISFYIFCHPSHISGKKCSLLPFRVVAKLYKADGRLLASYTHAEEIISRTIGRNESTIPSNPGYRNPQPLHVGSTAPTTAHFAGDEGDSGDIHPDPLAVPPLSLPHCSISSDVGVPFTTPAASDPLIARSFVAPLFFNFINPNRGYAGQRIKIYGATFYSEVKYYVKFGKLEPRLFAFENPGLLSGRVPESDERGQVLVGIATEEGYPLCFTMKPFVYISRDRKNEEEKIVCGFDDANLEDVPPDAKDAARRFKGSKKAHSACGSRQERRNGSASGDRAGAQDEMGDTLHDLVMEPTSKLVDIPMQGLTYQIGDGNPMPVFYPCRSWTGASAATSTTLVASTASLKAIKATSRKPSSQSIVSRWLSSNYGSETTRKRKRTRTHLEMEAPVGRRAVGGSRIGSSINLVLSPEPGKDDEEDLPVVLMDGGHNDRQVLKRRRMEAPVQPHASTCSPPMT